MGSTHLPLDLPSLNIFFLASTASLSDHNVMSQIKAMIMSGELQAGGRDGYFL